MLRLDFDPKDKELNEISWADFFEKFEKEKLAFLHQDIEIVAMLRHAPQDPPQAADRRVDATERAQRVSVARAPHVGGDVVVEIVDVDGRHTGVEVVRDREREQLAQPERDPELDREPFPAAGRDGQRIGDHPERRPAELDQGRQGTLHHHPREHDRLGDRAEQARSGGSLDHREGQQVAGGAAGEDAAVRASAAHDAPAPGRLGRLDVGRIAAPREVHVGLAALVIVVEARNVRPHAVHRGHLERRRRGREPDAHRRHPKAALAEQPREERRLPLGQRLLEDGAREPVDLDDQQSTPAGHGWRAEPEPTDQTIEGALQTEHQVVERHAPLL